MAISKSCEERWNYPNCIGAVNAKHVAIQPPADCGSFYYTYNYSHSIVVLLVAGADYECIYADIGTNGRVSYGGVWNKCSLAQKMNQNKVCLPHPTYLPFGTEEVPYGFVGDDAVDLKPHCMKPYAQAGLTDARRVCKYRHSRAHHISENVIGILANRWRFFRSTLLLPPETVEKIVLATLSLLNLLRKSKSWRIYCPVGLADAEGRNSTMVEGFWRRAAARESMIPITASRSGHNPCNSAKTNKRYF